MSKQWPRGSNIPLADPTTAAAGTAAAAGGRAASILSQMINDTLMETTLSTHWLVGSPSPTPPSRHLKRH